MADNNVLAVNTHADHDTRDKGFDRIRQLCDRLRQADDRTRRRKETLKEALREILALSSDPKTKPDQSSDPKTKPDDSSDPKTKPDQSSDTKTNPDQSSDPKTKPDQSSDPKTKPDQSSDTKTKPDQSSDPKTKPDESFDDEVKELAACLYDCARVRHFRGREDVGYVASDFDGAAEVGLVGMQCYCVLVSNLALDARTTWKRRRCEEDSVFDCLLLYAFLLCAEHLQPALWTSDVSVSTAEKLLSKLLDLCQVSVEDLLCGTSGRQPLFKKVLSFHLPHFTKTDWKERPSVKHVLQWCLLRVGFPYLSDYLDQVLPPSLLLVDDHEAVNQVLGVRCLTHIVDNVSKSELSWFGRVDVIYDCLQKLSYSHLPDVIDVLHPCLLKVLAAIEMKSKFSDEPRAVTRYDEMFQRLLYNMEMETTLDTRRVYSRHVSAYVSVIGIGVVKHFDQLFRVIFSYLEVFDSPSEETRLNVLDVLKTTILTCWPRIPRRSEDILKCLIKLLYCTITDKAVTRTDVKDELIARTVDCLLLVKRLCPQRTVATLNVIKDVGLGPECTLYIDQVLDTE